MKATGLHICPRCDSHFVQPLTCEEAGDHAWQVVLRCPECEWHHEGVYGDVDIQAFGVELDRGIELLGEDLQRLEAARFQEFIARVVTALDQDLIGADDFALPQHASAFA